MRSSSAVEQVTVNHFVAGSIPAFAAIAPVAQSVEQLTFNQLVRASSPRGCTIFAPIAQLDRATVF
jgi:hypothetical protein